MCVPNNVLRILNRIIFINIMRAFNTLMLPHILHFKRIAQDFAVFKNLFYISNYLKCVNL